MALGRLQASLAAATNEVTVSAANFNFDFSVVRYEAPKEYQILGQNLSRKRREAAEVGELHVTARRLGALLEGVCPPTPRLVSVYGSRVSEISDLAKSDGGSESARSLFGAHIGVDGTSIWAAATSSTTALHVQLLACMLARAWSAPEAISIWVELVKERRKDIAKRFEDGDTLPFAILNAATQSDISRGQLAAWDASARAWLRTADRVKWREQKKLLLILDNIHTTVNDGNVEVYKSVTSAWIAALESMENLVNGVSQAIPSGPTLLALSSWFLYPNIVLCNPTNKTVQMDDPLVAPGGDLTIGLEKSKGKTSNGIHWSLSLAHMKYYGRPVPSQSSINSASSRMTIGEFQQVVFGALLGRWSIVNPDQIKQAAKIFVTLETHVKLAIDLEFSKITEAIASADFLSCRWLHIMSRAAQSFISDNGEEGGAANNAIQLGLKRSTRFIGQYPSRSPFDYMCNSLSVIQGLSSRLLASIRTASARLQFLRYMSAKHDWPPGDRNSMIIRCMGDDGHPYYTSLVSQSDSYPWVRECGFDMGKLDVDIFQLDLDDNDRPNDVSSLLSSNDVKCFLLPSDRYRVRIETSPQIWYNYERIFNDISDTYILVPAPATPPRAKLQPDLDDLLWLLNLPPGELDLQAWFDHIESPVYSSDEVLKTLKALENVEMVYRHLSDATISSRVLERQMFTCDWARDLKYSDMLDTGTAWSCMAYLETGYLEILPEQLLKVFAMSTGDSIYIAERLLCDPYGSENNQNIVKVQGNIGKAGVAMLIPPQNLMLADIEHGSWRVIKSSKFNGVAECHFDRTSAHISFTDYSRPLGGQGERDVDVYYQESVVSIYDSGKWIGDVDILGALKSGNASRYQGPSTCFHANDCKPKTHILSVESWDGILDPPVQSFVVRAHGNWLARLALTAVLVQSIPRTVPPPYNDSLVDDDSENDAASEASTSDSTADSKMHNAAITLCPPKVCWAHCLQKVLENGPSPSSSHRARHTKQIFIH